MNNLPKIAVIMSTYNGEKYLKEQIDSILNQKDVDLTLFVFDDVSKDGTVDILNDYASKYNNIKVKVNEKNKNFTYNFLDALFGFKDNKEFEYYAFSDQDDFWVEDKLITAVNHIKEKGKCSLYCSNLKAVDINLKDLGKNSKPDDYVFHWHDQVTSNLTTGCTCVFDDAFKDLATLHYPEGLVYHDCWVGLIANYCKGANYILDMNPNHILYRQHGLQASGGVAEKLNIFERIKLFFAGHQINFELIKLFLANFGEEMNEEDKIVMEKFLNYKKLSNKFYLLKHMKRSQPFKHKIKLLLNRFVPLKQKK